jgi:hypothetical protein
MNAGATACLETVPGGELDLARARGVKKRTDTFLQPCDRVLSERLS